MTFLDTNIILRYLTSDVPKKAKKCEDLFKRVINGKELLYSTTLVIAEVVWVLEKAYKLPKNELVMRVQRILNTPNIEFDERDTLLAAVGLYSLKEIDFIDAYNAISMENKEIKEAYSYDSHFDQIPPIKRKEP